MKKKSTYYEKRTNLYGPGGLFSRTYVSPLIKWYQTDMTYEEKWRLNLLTYPEYMQWMQELAEQEQKDAAKKASSGAFGSGSGSDANTFWQTDYGDRQQLSSGEYAEFLEENHIDVSNRNALNFDALAADYADDASPIRDLTQDEILANVDRDIHGDSMLSQEEIEALFAAVQS